MKAESLSPPFIEVGICPITNKYMKPITKVFRSLFKSAETIVTLYQRSHPRILTPCSSVLRPLGARKAERNAQPGQNYQ